MNVSLTYFAISSLTSSPFLIYPTFKLQNLIKINNLQAKYFIQSLYFGSSNNIQCSFLKSKFTHFLSPPINHEDLPLIFSNHHQNSKLNLKSTYYSNQVIHELQIPSGPVLNVEFCLFKKCLSNDNAAAIKFISSQGQALLSETSFISCSSSFQSGAFYMNGAVNTNEPCEADTVYSTSCRLYYCCMNNCSGDSFGFLSKIVSKTIYFNHSYALDAKPSKTGSYCSSFYLQATQTDTNYINLTKINAVLGCSGLNLYNATYTYCRFHTSVQHNSSCLTYSFGRFVYAANYYAYHDHDNYVNSTVHARADSWGGVHFSRNSKIQISDCYISQISLVNQVLFRNDRGSIKVLKAQIEYTSIPYSGACSFSNVITTSKIETYNINIDRDVESCRYLIVPASFFTDSSEFTLSDCFSPSSSFSGSEAFSNSNQFSDSSPFTKSNQFSDSFIFTQSQSFTKSLTFSNSLHFTLSEVFEPSDCFSKSNYFTLSDSFSNSKVFSNSNVFTDSKQFSESIIFSDSQSFTNSIIFSNSQIFSNSRMFSKSDSFSNSDSFSLSSCFSKSSSFTNSITFSNSKIFSNSQMFTNSEGFSNSKMFSQSDSFSNSDLFSHSIHFSLSSSFSCSDSFTISNLFTNSVDFSNSNFFTQSDAFPSTNFFSHSLQFSLSLEFSQSDLFSLSNHFTNSNSFSLSNKFTNSNTFSQSNHFSKSNLFSLSEEFSISNDFTYSLEFTASEKHTRIFTISELFTDSLIFSNSNTFSESKGFTSSDPFTPDRNLPKSIPEPEGKKQSKTVIIVSILAALLLLIIIIIIIILLLLKRRKKEATDDDMLSDDKYNLMNKNQPNKRAIIPAMLAPRLTKDDLSYSFYDEEETYYEYEYESN